MCLKMVDAEVVVGFVVEAQHSGRAAVALTGRENDGKFLKVNRSPNYERVEENGHVCLFTVTHKELTVLMKTHRKP